jgi:hypothetical protein
VHVSPLFATFAADWNPFGLAFWVSVAICGSAALSICTFSPLPVSTRNRVLLALPGAMALGCLLTRWVNSRSADLLGTWYFYKFYFAELDAAFVVFLAFGVGFTVAAARSRDRACRILGWSISPLFVALFAAALWYVNGGFGWFRK